MQDISKKTVLITGASSGIGQAAAHAFAKSGAKLLICARNQQKIEQLKQDIESKYDASVYAFQLDVRNQNGVEAAVKAIPESFKAIDILVNNAGLARGFEKFQDNLLSDWEEMIDTNVKGLLYMTREILPDMLKKNNGHIINIGSIAGIAAYPKGGVYCASKSAVKLISDGLRQDVVDTAIRVTNVQPGLVETNFSNVRFHGDVEKADGVYSGIQALSSDDIADIILYAAASPAHVQICEVTVTPTNQATGGVLHKA